MDATHTAISLLQNWCRDAVAECGDNWPLIEEYVRQKLASLPDADRRQLAQEVSVLLSSAAQDNRYTKPN